jgi:hypothetical protein
MHTWMQIEFTSGHKLFVAAGALACLALLLQLLASSSWPGSLLISLQL